MPQKPISTYAILHFAKHGAEDSSRATARALLSQQGEPKTVLCVSAKLKKSLTQIGVSYFKL
jgi:hypothetical protein